MTRPGSALASLPVLSGLFALTVGLHIAIHWAKRFAGGDLLDFRLTGEGATALLAEMAATPGQTEAHLWITATLDMLYPVAYGALVLGLCLRYAPRRPLVYAAPILLAAGLDLAENAVQLSALLGSSAMLGAKTLLTPGKFVFAAIGSVIATGLWARAVFTKA